MSPEHPFQTILIDWQFLHSNHNLLTAQQKIWPKLIWDHPTAYRIEYELCQHKMWLQWYKKRKKYQQTSVVSEKQHTTVHEKFLYLPQSSAQQSLTSYINWNLGYSIQVVIFLTVTLCMAAHTQCHNLQDHNLYLHCHEKLKSCIGYSNCKWHDDEGQLFYKRNIIQRGL
jgi:hypothetical protein